jgi:hypothetical protein
VVPVGVCGGVSFVELILAKGVFTVSGFVELTEDEEEDVEDADGDTDGDFDESFPSLIDISCENLDFVFSVANSGSLSVFFLSLELCLNLPAAFNKRAGLTDLLVPPPLLVVIVGLSWLLLRSDIILLNLDEA